MAKIKIGRPTIMTPETIAKLEEIFALGGSDEEACFYAGIGKSTLYNYQEEHEDFVERKEALKETPILLARRTAVAKINESYANAMDFLKRKKRLEFGDKTDLDISSLGEKVGVIMLPQKNESKDTLATSTETSTGTSAN